MEGQDSGDSSARAGRWTCEACGCHTNTVESLSCGICGTRRAPSLLRRAGHSAASRLFSRSFAARRGSSHEDQYDFEDSVDLDSDGMGGDEEEQAVAALALEVSGVTGAARAANAHGLERRLRSLGAGSAALPDARPAPDEILLAATENASLYQPRWADAAQLGGRHRANYGIVLGTGGHGNVAHLGVGSGEGQAVRAVDPFPRGSLPPNRLASTGNSSRERKRRRIFGFRVSFDHPRREVGSNMGGCYLVGVTTSSFHAFGERNGLQQSRFFWGIEDGGSKYEGSRHSHSSRASGRGGSSNYGVEVGRSEAPRNSDNVLFGSREVVTVVVDLETRTLTYWRDGRLLGTLVFNLPRSGNIYPVVVPFNAGVSVAISGMDGTPLPLLQSFVSDWKRSQNEKEELRRQSLAQERSLLVKNGRITPELKVLLTTIFSWYTNSNVCGDGELYLDAISASRLWYRCGMKLSSLESILEKSGKGHPPSPLTLTDFLELIARIVQEDEDASNRPRPDSIDFGSQGMPNFGPRATARSDTSCAVGDIVGLVEGHEKYGDASSGPLHPGDRGRVVEVQQGPKGERHSIRVLYNGRRWWYQPQALLTERSGLIETPAVWFLRNVLRSHGFDHETLQPLWGKQVTASSWQVGDLVVPHRSPAIRTTKTQCADGDSPSLVDSTCVGRIVAESSTSASSIACRGRESGTVLVEFVDPSFGVTTGVLPGSALDQPSPEVQTKRVRVSKLAHATCFKDPNRCVESKAGKYAGNKAEHEAMDVPFSAEFDDECIGTTCSIEDIASHGHRGVDDALCVVIGQKLKDSIAGVARLESTAIDIVKKECEKSSASLAGIFAAGLPAAIFSAIDRVELELRESRSGRDISTALSSLGALAVLITKRLCPIRENDQFECIHGSPLVARDLKQSPTQSPAAHEHTRRSDSARNRANRRFLPQPESLENSAPHHLSQMGVRDLIRGLNNGGDLPSSPQHRRSMLLALMSGLNNSATSVMGENNLSLEMGLDGGSPVPPSPSQLLSSLGQLRPGGGVPPFLFGQQNSLSPGSSWSELACLAGGPGYQGHFNVAESNNGSASLSDQGNTRSSQSDSCDAHDRSLPVLDSFLRGRGEITDSKSMGKGIGGVVSTTTRSFIQNGLLGNNLVWVKAMIDAQMKRSSSNSLRSSSFTGMQNSDEEGTPLLLLTIALGCSVPFLNELIRSGATVGEKEVRKAALTNQPESLSLLLRHSVYAEGSVEVAECSREVAEVLRLACDRQKMQEESMRNEGSSFVSSLIGKLLKLGLVCCRHRTRKGDLCRRKISETLVGNVLLHAMHRSQQEALSATKRGKEVAGGSAETEAGSENGRVPLFHASQKDNLQEERASATKFSPRCLLEVVPVDVLLDTFVKSEANSKEGSLTTFFSLVEAYLWSRDIDDVAVGLKLVSHVLRKVPILCLSPAVERYGLREMAVSHEFFAKNALTEIMAHQLPFHLIDDAVSSGRSACRDPSDGMDASSFATAGVVVCPKKHVAELHLTRHSSFRCDLCGKGVERGMPMYGCRECDWDACERCTDKAEGGIVKWRRIRELSFECQRLLSATDPSNGARGENNEMQTEKILECLRPLENATELCKLSSQIRHGDHSSLEELAFVLAAPGQITMHEFASSILPALHSALVGRPSDRAQVDMGSPQISLGVARSRRNKKPRVGRSFQEMEDVQGILCPSVSGNTDKMVRNLFCRKIVEHLVFSPQEQKRRAASMGSEMDDHSMSEATAEENSNIPLLQMNERDEDGGEDEESDDGSAERRRGESQQGTTNRGSPEILRRLNDVLAFHERVAVTRHKSNTNRVSGSQRSESGDLQSLTHPLEIELLSSTTSNRAYDRNSLVGLNTASCGSVVYVEPLMPISDLQLHVLRTCHINDPFYTRFCRRLALERAIIAERPSSSCVGGTGEDLPYRRLAQVISYDETTGAHAVRYASGLKRNACIDTGIHYATCRHNLLCDQLDFNGEEALLVLAARDYCILHRSHRGRNAEVLDPFDMETELLLSDADVLLADGIDAGCGSELRPAVENDMDRSTSLGVGMRVESVCGSSDESWRACTIVSVDHGSGRGSQATYVLVSDEGEVFRGVEADSIRGNDARLTQRRANRERDRLGRGNFASGAAYPGDRAFPFFGVRPPASDLSRGDTGRPDSTSTPRVGVLKRTWSALSPIEDMSPVELNFPSESTSKSSTETRSLTCSVAGSEIEILVNQTQPETPPLLRVELSAHENLPTVDLGNADEVTVYCAVRRLFERDERTRLSKLSCGGRNKLYYSVTARECLQKTKGGCRSFEKDDPFSRSYSPPWRKSDMENETGSLAMLAPHSNSFVADEVDIASASWSFADERGRKLNSIGLENDIDAHWFALCDGIDEICVQCMEIMSILAEGVEEHWFESKETANDSEEAKEMEKSLKNDPESMKAFFESEKLTNKLIEQLEDPLTVVGGALPEWCTSAPTFAPRIFSYASRRLLLERAAFGVSRSALRQQEAKVAVGPLRQRMAALRGRAVELVGEAFSGGAEDPTALQLQADELYGMEEALAARVNAAFRAQKWDERSLQSAKAAIRREMLLSDAAAVMDRYANDSRVRRRRLEVRFEGESGFDASLDEAGVTRGFYSDIAEQLLSCDHVSGVYCKPVCAADTSAVNEVARLVENKQELPGHQVKLPLWIPDMDSSQQVVIPTPRADPRSGLGLYPRPLAAQHPQFKAVLGQFRFMGRLFASALRDGFVFPLPLSTTFLKMVQNGSDATLLSGQNAAKASSFNSAPCNASRLSSVFATSGISTSPALNRNPSVEEMSVSDTSASGNVSFFGGMSNYSSSFTSKKSTRWQLSSLDLPRPGFLGGEVYAVEVHVCAALDKLDEANPPLSKAEHDKRCKEIASDKTFAKRALGKSYDCSFEEYFEGKAFVDPLDPAQGEDAVPLCQNGHMRAVTIHNVREWVVLAKEFILHDGVIQQSLAFRRGIEDFFSPDYLSLFTAEELQRDVCGGGDNVDKWDETNVRSLFKLDGGRGAAEALVAVAAMGGEGGAALSRRFGPASPTVGYLVKALLEASPTRRRQFLSFVTSVPIVTPGQIEVVPMVNPAGEFLPMRDPGCLPRANTCARRLYLPKFESYDSFSQVLWAVVREESRFKGFYEWRG